MRFPLRHHSSRFVIKLLFALLNRDGHPICPNHVALTRARWCRPIACQIAMVFPFGIQDRGGWEEECARVPPITSSLSFAAPSKKFGGQLSQTSLSIV
ncbi:hypothetical protein [Bradyrhizobium sp. LB13.1]